MPSSTRTGPLVTVPASLVPYFRSGLVAELGSAIDLLNLQLALREIEQRLWRVALTHFDAARELIDALEARSGAHRRDVALTPSAGGARVMIDALRAIYEVEAQRLRNAEAAQVYLPMREIPALRAFIVELEKNLAPTATAPDPLLGQCAKRTPQSVKHADESTEP